MDLLRAESEVRPKEGSPSLYESASQFSAHTKKLAPTPAAESRARKCQPAREMTEPRWITSHISMAPHMRLRRPDGARTHVTMP